MSPDRPLAAASPDASSDASSDAASDASPGRARAPSADAPARSPKAEQILAGGMEVFLSRGYAAASMDRVAAAAGVSKATLYSHFQDKETLFAALVERTARRKFPDLFDRGALPEGDPETVLRTLAATALDRLSNDPEHLAFMRLIVGESARFPQLARIFVSRVTKVGMDRVSRYLAAHPELDVPDPEAAARVFLGTLIAFVMTQELLHGKAIVPMESDRVVAALVHLLCRPVATA